MEYYYFELFNIDKVLKINDTFEFHDSFTKKLCGYEDVLKMFKDASCKDKI